MILSMTGFGRAITTSKSKKFTIEIKSLNSKQLDLNIRVPASCRELEVSLRPHFSSVLQRGKVEATAVAENIGTEASVTLNIPLMETYKKQLEEMASTLGIGEPEDWYSTLLRLPDSITHIDSSKENEDDIEALTKGAIEALEHLVEFRRLEGAKLEVFFKEKIDNIETLLKEVEPFEKERIPHVRQRLEEQLSRLNTPEYDKDRLEQELIFYIEKLDVTEEKTRLASHLDYFRQTLALPDAGQGKKLGFIAQEMGREINTLGSKSNHAGMQQIVVKMKDELEQIKEQVLNVL
jgi:uncharacterized protein (TIGR00255 family)